MIPLYDTVRTHKFPFINILIIALNVLAFFYELQLGSSALERFIFTWGAMPGDITSNLASAWPTIFTSMFLHGGWFHLLSNMWFLYIFGDNVEARMGGIRYLIFYLLSGVAAVFLQAYFQPGSSVPMIGASGAIAGVLGAYLISFPRSRIASLVPILFIFTIIEIPAVIFLVLWFLSQLYSGWFAMQGAAAAAGGVAWWAHIGGFVFGVITVSFFVKRTIRRNWYQE
ncbi:MAG TPA: rhomboid family intramembrane serine protease [Anaerolineales bacterium]|nr:rhomboid family intramembrane serine protease [Anaerolineales bacterium]